MQSSTFRWRPLAWSLLTVVGCGPDTELGRRPAPPAQAATAGGGPMLELVAPHAGSADVPTNLAALVVRSLEPDGGLPALLLRGPDGAAVPLGEARALPCGWGEGACHEVPVKAVLTPGATYALDIVEAGRALAHLTTAAEPDREPPRLIEAAVSFAADCLRVTGTSDETVAAALAVRTADGEELAFGSVGGSVFDFPVRLVRLPPGTAAMAIVQARDLAGNLVEAPPVPLTVAPPPSPLVITEVLANPAGAEGTQEFVELRNLGAAAVTLGGLSLEDDGGADPLPPVTLEPGAFALVVPQTYAADTSADVPPRAGTPLVRVAGRLGKDGLTGHEGVRLRDGTGAVLSSYGGWVDTAGTAWSGRSVQRLPDAAACDHPRAWSQVPLPPTPGW